MPSIPEPIFPASNAARPWALTLRTEQVFVIVIAAIQIAILAAMIVLDGLPLLLGERIKLQVIPLDPRDLFRGDSPLLTNSVAAVGDWRKRAVYFSRLARNSCCSSLVGSRPVASRNANLICDSSVMPPSGIVKRKSLRFAAPFVTRHMRA